MDLTVSNSGSRPIVKAVVRSFLRENLHARETYVQVVASGVRKIWTSARLRTTHVIALDSTSARNMKAGAKDQFGTWSEWSELQSVTTANFSAGESQRSIGSLALDDISTEEPSAVFPDLSIGTGIVQVHRTLVSENAFFDEQRRAMQSEMRASFRVLCADLDSDQASLLQRFARSVNFIKPFYFDFTDPNGRDDTRYVARFQDPTVGEELARSTFSNVTFNLIELPKFSVGGDIA